MALDGIKFTKEGREYILAMDGTVHLDGLESASGNWTTQAEADEAKNKITVKVEGEDSIVLPCIFTFTEEDNQLEIGLKNEIAGIEDVKPFVFNGQIFADDKLDLRYRILKTQGEFLEKDKDIILYGDLEFDSVFRLKINLFGGGEAVIEADFDAPVEADFLDQLVDEKEFRFDRMQFIAFTWNYFKTDDGRPISIPERAKIDFKGDWGLSRDGLVFNVRGEKVLEGADSDLTLTLQGKYKAVSTGLQVTLEDGDLGFDLLVGGEHEFIKEGGVGFWRIAVGYQADKIRTKISGAAIVPVGGDGEFKIGGQLTVDQGPAEGVNIELALAATYEFKHGAVVMKAKVASGEKGLSYQILLDGKIRFLDGELQLALDVGDGTLKSLALTYTPGMDSIFGPAGLEVSSTEDGLAIDFNFEIGFSWVNGMFLGTDYKTLTG